jgi:sugar lactone lactonase YvrE
MSPVRTAVRVLAVAVAFSSSLFAAEPEKGPAQNAADKDPGPFAHYERGAAALGAKKLDEARKELSLAAAALPDEPDVLTALAKAEALTGDSAAALKHLSHVVAMGYGLGAETDPAFASLSSLPAFRALVPAIAENARPITRSTTAFTVAEVDLIPEGIAWDPGTRALFLGSLSKHKIVVVSSDGRVRDFIPSNRDGLPLVLGMKVDRDRAPASLWVCSAEGDPAEGENTSRRSFLYRFDLATGKTLRKIPSPAGGRHLFNDLAIAKNGDIYFTDSEEGSFYRLPAGADSLERLVPADTLPYPNGIALSDDGKLLYVAHAGGILLWDVAKRVSSPLAVVGQEGVYLGGIDGLSFAGGALIGIQNGATPHRVSLFTLAPSLDRVTSLSVLERGNPLFDIPTTGAVAGDSYYFMANTQLRALGPGGVVKEPDKRKPVVILKLALPR